VPYLSPDIVLLFKSKHVVMERNPLHDHFEEQQKNDEADFQAVYPTLDREKSAWLKKALHVRYPEGHPWLEHLT
ncbi:MAG TPA: hypothetical protein VM409_05905, partial [Chloroflexia bacterium]|nr:hypothetical protein [Chloroflexia bacterium]